MGDDADNEAFIETAHEAGRRLAEARGLNFRDEAVQDAISAEVLDTARADETADAIVARLLGGAGRA